MKKTINISEFELGNDAVEIKKDLFKLKVKLKTDWGEVKGEVNYGSSNGGHQAKDRKSYTVYCASSTDSLLQEFISGAKQITWDRDKSELVLVEK